MVQRVKRRNRPSVRQRRAEALRASKRRWALRFAALVDLADAVQFEPAHPIHANPPVDDGDPIGDPHDR